jgi:hypothetical protein
MNMDIKKYNPCEEGFDYYKSKKDFKEAWEQCPRGDWMLWTAKKLRVDHRVLTLAKALCAKTVLHLMTDERSVKAVSVAEAYGRGEVTKDAADAAAAYAADAADAAADAYAADAYAADAAAAYAAYAAYAADAAADAAAAAYAAAYADADARKKNEKKTAAICRDILTKEIYSKLSN